MFFSTHDGVTLLKSHLLSQYREINHCFTTRLSGFSKNSFASFNVSYDVGDDAEVVTKNRLILSSVLNIKLENFVYAKQVLENNVAEAVIDKKEMADGIITSKKHLALFTQSADCVLILMFDPVKQAIANLHASWRGTLGEICKSGIMKMKELFGSKAENLIVAISPAVGSCCYEIKDDVSSLFKSRLPYSFKFIKNEETKMRLNLPEMNKYQLLCSGVKDKNIEVADLCTKCNEKLFYSYRRDGKNTGRFCAVIVLK